MMVTKNDITELKSMNNPPDAVKKVMGATFLLLGYPESITTDWKQLHNFMTIEAMHQMMFPPDKLSPDFLMRAKADLSGISIESIRKVSAAAAGLFIWCDGRLKIVEAEKCSPHPTGVQNRPAPNANRSIVNIKDIVELKTLIKPPLYIHRLVGATCLLLGYPENIAMDWKLQNRVFLCDQKALDQVASAPDKLKPECLMRAKANLSGMSRHTIKTKSSAAEGLYVWCEQRLEVLESM